MFLPFGKQLRGDAGDTLGWHIPNVSGKYKDFVDPPLKASRVVVIDSEPETPTPKVLLHEIGHAVGNVDLGDSAMIMGPANAKGTKEAPIGCQPDRPDNLMTATEVEKFCKDRSDPGRSVLDDTDRRPRAALHRELHLGTERLIGSLDEHLRLVVVVHPEHLGSMVLAHGVSLAEILIHDHAHRHSFFRAPVTRARRTGLPGYTQGCTVIEPPSRAGP